MPPQKIDRTERQVLLSERDRQNAEVIIRNGLAENVSQAIRVGLAFGAQFVNREPLVTPTTP